MFLISAGLMLVYTHAHGQTDSSDNAILKKRIYKVSITGIDGHKSSGYLSNLSDSNVYTSSSKTYFNNPGLEDRSYAHSYNNIAKVQIKRKGSTGRGAWRGALIGFAVGAIAGLISGDDPPSTPYNNPNDPFGNAIGNGLNTFYDAFRMTAGEKAVAGGFAGAVTGSAIGAITGSLIKKTFIIGGNKQKLHDMRQQVLEKLYVR